MYGMYPNPEQWRINVTFIAVLAFTAAGFFVPAKFRNYLSLYYTILLPIISFMPGAHQRNPAHRAGPGRAWCPR